MSKESSNGIKRAIVFSMVAWVTVAASLTCSYAADEATIQKLKEQLIVANKVLDYEKLATPFGHISARIPGTDTFLITGNVAPGMATIDDILVCDLNGKILQGKLKNTYSEVVIHTGVYKKRKDINSVAHTHSQYVIALSMADLTVEPANLQAIILGPEPIALYKKMVWIDTPALGEELVDFLGPNNAVILKGHGALLVGRNIVDATYYSRILESCAQSQWLARSVGKLSTFTEEEKQRAIEFTKKSALVPGGGRNREWDYYEKFKLPK